MRKKEFLDQLRRALTALPNNDADERLNFYAEMIDDRMEDGMCEEEAVASVGTAEEIATQILAETPLTKIVKEKIKGKKRSALEITLLCLGSPIWGSLLISALAVVFSVYVSAWAVIVSLWAVFGSLAGCALGCTIGGVVFAFTASVATGLATIATGLGCAGLSIFGFFGCLGITKAFCRLTRVLLLWVKRCFVKKEVAK